MSNKTYRPLLEKLGGVPATNYIGKRGELFYDPESTTLRIADGVTEGGQVVSGGGGSTGDITFSGIQIIGQAAVDFPLGGIQLIPQVEDVENGFYFERDGQYLDVYPTIGQDAPHIHITAGILDMNSPYYDSELGYLKGDLYIGDDSNYVAVYGDGDIQIYSTKNNITVNFENNRLNFDVNGNDVTLDQGVLDFESRGGIARPQVGYTSNSNTAEEIFVSRGYIQTTTLKLMAQFIFDSGNVQTSEIVCVRNQSANTIYSKVLYTVSDETNSNAYIQLTAGISFDSGAGTNRIQVFANNTSGLGAYSYNIFPIELNRFVD